LEEGRSMTEKIILRIESIILFIFGLFHTHRIWAFINPKQYSEYWLGILENSNYLLFAVILILLSGAFVVLFFINIKMIKWWRILYLFGGLYVLFDVITNIFGVKFMNELVKWMFTVQGIIWYLLWGTFVIFGIICIITGLYLWKLSIKKLENT
jgi:hypothetical protein